MHKKNETMVFASTDWFKDVQGGIPGGCKSNSISSNKMITDMDTNGPRSHYITSIFRLNQGFPRPLWADAPDESRHSSTILFV